MSLGEFLRGEHHKAKGSSAESDGAAWLQRQGFTIVERNVGSRFGELDIVARESETLCFIEVKARQTERFGAPAEAVTLDKQRRISRCAQYYLARKPYDGYCRFDVLAMTAEAGNWRFELFRDAFATST